MLFCAFAADTQPARSGPFLFRFLLHGSWLARAVHGRCDGSQGTAALDRGAQHSHRPSEPPRAPRCAASKLCTILPINFQARKPRLLPRPRQETQLFTSSRRRRQTDRAKPLGITRRPKVKSHNTMEEPGIEPAAKSGLRPRRRPSARASARRGKQISHRLCSVSRASIHAKPQDHVSRVRAQSLARAPGPHLRNN